MTTNKTFKDNEFLSRPIKRDLAQVEQQIEALKKAEPKQGESPTARNEQIQNLEARKKKLEDKLNSLLKQNHLAYLFQFYFQDNKLKHSYDS